MALSQIWTLESGGVEKTLAAWGISSAMLTRRTQRADVLEVRLDGARFDGSELFPYQTTIVLKRGGVKWFVGRATRTPRMARPAAEGAAYIFEGPWWFLEHVLYQQTWTFLRDVVYRADGQYYGTAPDSGAAPQSERISNLILAASQDGLPVTTGAQIADAVGIAIDAGAPMQAGVIDPALVVPSEAARDITCAEVIRRMLRWHPDCVAWFDYSTSPLPTLHIRAQANLAAAEFSVASLPAAAADIAARPDLGTPGVVLKYETVYQVDDQDQRVLTVDKYPPAVSETTPGAIVMTINLTGERQWFQRQYVKTAGIRRTSLAWWKERLPWLRDPRITDLVFTPDTEQTIAMIDDDGFGDDSQGGNPDYNPPSNNTAGGLDKGTQGSGQIHWNHLIEGEIPNWVSGHAQMVLVQAAVDYDVYQGEDENGNDIYEHRRNESVWVKLMSTDLATGWYSRLDSLAAGEPVPEGLAEGYYHALNQLQYEGAFELAAEECGASGALLGKVLNLTGGLAEWAAMRATIFETREDLAAGRTLLRFGPAEYLSPRDWIAWLRVNRWRSLGDRAARVHGLVSRTAQTGGTGRHDSGGRGGKGPPRHTIQVGDTAVVYNPTSIAAADAALVAGDLEIRPRPVQMCVPGEGTKTFLVLCSEGF